MRRIEIEVRGGNADHESGRVAIFLDGLEQLDDNAIFYLRPLDAVARGDDLGELANDQSPAAVRAVEGGIELVLGPDVTRNPLLLPGSSVEIEIPEAGVWSEFTWPAMRMQPRARRVKGGATRLVQAPTGHDDDSAASAADLNASGAVAAASPAAMPVPANYSREETAPMAREQQPPEPEFRDVGDEHRAAPGQEYVVFYPHARGGKLGPTADREEVNSARRAKSILPTTRLGSAVMAVAALLAVQAAMWMGSSGAPVPTASSVATVGGAPAEGSLYDLFAVGTVSPRGVPAGNVATARALENAQAALLTPGAPRDSDEGAYWLRRFISSGGADERTRRVLTQLGTAFADGTNRPADYGRARQVWELASAFGDSVAMCFLGTLHENGLGTAADRRVALQWFECAKLAGGCPSVDESIARVKK